MTAQSPNGFPQGFLWGAATSSHQVEGGNSNNDWWDWELAGGSTDLSGAACDSWNRFEEDFDLARELKHNSHRFSIEWSRVQPEENRWNEDAIARYAAMVRALRARGLEPIVTLHHFTNPRWLAARGGWEDPATVKKFAIFVRRMAEALGEDVRYWVTINEPMVFVYHGYIAGMWPPGKASLPSALKAMAHMARAHCMAYEVLHEVYRKNRWTAPQVGIAHAMQVYAPHTRALRDRTAAYLRTLLNNRLFLKLIWHSSWYLPAHYFGTGGKKRAMDFIGVNYYFREILTGPAHVKHPLDLLGTPCKEDERYKNAEKSDLAWEIYPEGIRQVLKELKRFKLPVMVTENGICTSDEALRKRFTHAHLGQVLAAIREGVHVIGYQCWSLIDNFEWSFGFKPRFGLAHVDFQTQKRTVKESSWDYARICEANALPEGAGPVEAVRPG